MKHALLLIGSFALVLAACTPSVQTDSENQTSSAAATSSSSSAQNSSSAPVAMMRIALSRSSVSSKDASSSPASSAHEMTDEDWRKILTPDQFAVLRQGGTETPFTSPLVDEHRKGTFYSVDCNQPLFRSEQKYDSGTGWPSFWAPIAPDAITTNVDTSAGMTRTEVLSTCGGHLGHVFNDGPQPTGLRYCMNGLALKFVPDAEQ